jgi:hypothetical protein
MPPIYPDRNGNRTSYCSIEFGVNGTPIKGVKSINYKDTLEIKKIKGTSAKPIGRNRGTLDFEGDIELYQAEWLALLPILTLGGTVGFSEMSHTITVVYAELLSPGDTVIDRLVGVRFHSPEVANSEDGDLASLKVTLDIMDIVWANRYRSLRTVP